MRRQYNQSRWPSRCASLRRGVLAVGLCALGACDYGRHPLHDDPELDPFGPDGGLELDLGRSEGDCPVPPRFEASTLRARPLDVITLRALPGAAGLTPEPIDRWRFRVLSRPQGSTSQVVERYHDAQAPTRGGDADDVATPEARFYLDLAGRYVFAVDAAVGEGPWSSGSACPAEAARLVVDVVPESPVHVELVWHTPGDVDETDDDGTDLDLHLLHPQGAPLGFLDCYYGNDAPDWDAAGSAGDPNLDIDDVDGAGPENIRIGQPSSTVPLGGPYRVMVHSYRLTFLGGENFDAEATLRVYLDGALAHESRHLFQSEDEWWGAAFIHVEPGRTWVTDRP